MCLQKKESKNQITLLPNQKKCRVFNVNFFIDGKWTIVKVKDSFPQFEHSDELVGVTPKTNELFLMILEKAWAQINGGYNHMEGGKNCNIFELFLGCKCDYFSRTDDKNYAKKLFSSIKLNQQYFGTLSLCGQFSMKKKIIKLFQMVGMLILLKKL